MECNCNNNNNGGVIPWVRGNRLPLCICIYQMNVDQGTVSTMAYNTMTRTPYAIQADDTVTVTMKSGFRSVEMPFTTDGNKVLVIDNGELPTGTYTIEVTIQRGSGERGRWQETRQVRIYENTDDAMLGEMYSIDADLFFWAKGDTGNGIANITSNPDDTLTITMTDGTTYTTQAMKGDKGDKGDQGEKGTSIVSFDVTGQTDTSVIYTVTFSDDTTEEVAVPKGPQGDTGLTGNGISSTTLNSDYTLTIAYTDGTTYTTSSIRGAQGVQGVSVIGFTQTGETSTNTLYNVVFSDGRTQSVAIPKGLKGDKGDTGNTGSQGGQGPKGDTVTATDYTLYNVQGSSSEGAMSQDATTKAISAQTGYYTCGTSGSTAAKVVTVENGNLYKLTLGGHFKVKMTNANTASGVTLQVGSETATTLWYNGAAVSATNTWDAGEVISVYYDGSVYQASNAQGGSNKKIDAYLYGDLRILAVGQAYEEDEDVKTTDKQLLKITKGVKSLSLSETLAAGDIKVYVSKTYRAASTISTYNPNPSTPYSAGAYALGIMTVYTLTVTAESVTAGNITVNGTDVAVEATDDASAIASKIADALVIDGWTDSASENIVTVRCNTIGNNTTTITIGVGDTGVVVSGNSTPSVTGTDVIMKYDGESWTTATPSGMVTDGVLVEVDAAWLASNAAQQNTLLKDTTVNDDIDISSISKVNCYMYKDGNTWKWQNNYTTGGGNWGKFLKIEGGRSYIIVARKNIDTNYGFLKNNTHATGNVSNYATGETGHTILPGTSERVIAPYDAEYLFFNTINVTVTREPESIIGILNIDEFKQKYDNDFDSFDGSIKTNEAAIKNINDFPDIVLTGEESVDMASLEERNCSLGSNDAWYYYGYAGKHKAIEVIPDGIVGIRITGFDYGFYGWVTSSYTPPTHGNTIPYADGGRASLNMKESFTYLKVPAGAKYLIICTVNGDRTRINWEVVTYTYKYRHNDFAKFRVAHWNIGHFSGYDGVYASFNPTITPENAEAMARRYKQVINDVGADVLGIAEYDTNFTTDGQKSKDIIFQCYNKILEGAKLTYNCNTLMFNGFKFINSYEKPYTSRSQYRYMKFVNVEINGRTVHIVETHWDSDSAAHKRSQATQLLNLVKDCQYVIIGGDLNTYDTKDDAADKEEDAATLKMFRDAGFEFANNGYLDPFTTATDGGSVDHIMAKGFSMSNRHTVDVSGTLSDHYLLYCDLVMNP